ncbi:hypothetical protein [Aureivirga sp. CE67]|uniref:hypothetical protein n=1 Tax=Aureivirga sp. CE67 TaxID=1788983 RepID=UPI0018C8D8C3|nr:hypothetical protein [Aureivirga sp. CE67]
MIIPIVGAVIVTVLLAIVIVKFIPKKLHPLVSIVLIGAAVFMGWKIYTSIMEPINFNIEKKKRYAKVIDQLKVIRDAENAYKRVNGKYIANADSLVQFIDTAKFAITQSRDTVITVKESGLDLEKEIRVVDTIGYEPVINSFQNRNYKNLLDVPGTNVKFTLGTAIVEKVAGLKAPTFEAKVKKSVILEGMNPHLIRQEEETIQGDEVRGEHISVGSLEEVKDSGNWPPFYDENKKGSNNE